MKTSHQRSADGLIRPPDHPNVDPELLNDIGHLTPQQINEWIWQFTRWIRQAKRLANHKARVSN